MKIRIVFAREADGRWIGEEPEYPGVLVYGRTREEARIKAEALARLVLRERSLN
ncbi:MAG: type II toxin-antitoxin system HicB family antitoxin [Terracidiphilus sp.]